MQIPNKRGLRSKRDDSNSFKHKLKIGDKVIVIAGGSSKHPVKGKVGRILKFVSRKGQTCVIVEGVNIRKKLLRATKPGDSNRIVATEFPIHYSNVLYFVESLGKGVRLKWRMLEDGTKVRGYIDPQSREFVRI